MDDVVEAAAAWWARQLDHPQFHNSGCVMADRLATALSFEREPLSEATIERFRTALVELIRVELSRDGASARSPLVITTDYQPDRMLAAALAAAGIEHGEDRLPIKTELAIYPRRVRVAQGSTGKLRQVLP